MNCLSSSLLVPNSSLLIQRRVSVSTRYFLFDRQVCTANTLTRQIAPRGLEPRFAFYGIHFVRVAR